MRLSDDDRCQLARLGKALGRKLLRKVANIVTPDTIMALHRRLVAAKWTYSRKGPGRPPVIHVIRRLVVRMATDNPSWGIKRIQGALRHGVGAQFTCPEKLSPLPSLRFGPRRSEGAAVPRSSSSRHPVFDLDRRSPPGSGRRAGGESRSIADREVSG